jgi:hypothetical protein
MGLLSRANDNSTELSSLIKTVTKETAAFSGTPEELIKKYCGEFNNSSCILFENPSNEGEKTQFCQKVNTMIDKMGAVISLSTGCPLIMLPLSIDRELIAHRLSKTLNAKIHLSFQADNSEIVIDRINSML